MLIRQAILLHDTVEDSDRTIDDIENIFGKTMAKIVDGITCYDRMGRKLTKHETYQKFIEYSKQDYRCLIVKLFDCIDNLETLHGLLPEKQIIFKNEKRRVYLPIFIGMIDIVPHRYRAMYVKKVEVMR
jgi:GTP diphosphokinase / guanosine-3',5'-bis(diphosphate) 3'-diphosphatase